MLNLNAIEITTACKKKKLYALHNKYDNLLCMTNMTICLNENSKITTVKRQERDAVSAIKKKRAFVKASRPDPSFECFQAGLNRCKNK